MSEDKSKIRKKKDKHCNDCDKVGNPELFVAGRNLCLDCHRERVKDSRAKNAFPETLELEVDTLDFEQVDLSEAFISRDGLSEMLKTQLQAAINRALKQIHYQEKRLESATAKGNAKLIDQASKALNQAEARHDAILIKLMEKLQAMEDLRMQSEKAKPVAFFYITDPVQPLINSSHEVPEAYYPETAGGNSE